MIAATMKRVPEAEIMNGAEQVAAYARADFAAPNRAFLDRFRETFPGFGGKGVVFDLGCGPADITAAFARSYPACRLVGIDASPKMIAWGRRRVREEGLEKRVKLRTARVPGALPPTGGCAAVISNSLLHHLPDPDALWREVRACCRPGGAVLVVDLARPVSRARARELVETYSGAEPEILKHDFFNSLLAGFTPEEVRHQLIRTGLERLTVEMISDRHLGVWGRLPSPS
ncbi:MAG TPA: class I SAM-dependent methyltransferase [bacterium]|nr:class I SAM-dependent methyltransferase [bacterium]HPJ71067.1 class I SAM-dependent methyltransferase [bacterium]HPQ65848.1 class I SAM-dependent methyltransferase [bacterium]